MAARKEAPGRSRRAKAVAPQPEMEQAEERFGLSGSLLKRLTEIRSSNSNLVTTYGTRSDGSSAMLPLVDLQLFGQLTSDEKELLPTESGPEMFSGLLTLDNLAFLLQDMAGDLCKVVRLLGMQSTSELALPETQGRYTSKMLRFASISLSNAADDLDRVLDGKAPDEGA